MKPSEALHFMRLAVDIALSLDVPAEDKAQMEQAYQIVAAKTRTADRLEGIKPGIRVSKDERGGWMFRPRDSAPILSESLDKVVTAALEYTTAIEAD